MMFRPSGSGGVVQSTSPAGTTPTIANVSVPLVNTEVSHALPDGTVRWSLYNRTEGQTRVAFSAGQTGVTYVTLPPGSVMTEEHAPSSGLILYVRCPKAGQVLELLSWGT